MKLLESNKSNIIKVKVGEDVPNVDFKEVVLYHCNVVNNNFQQYSKFCYEFIPKKLFV